MPRPLLLPAPLARPAAALALGLLLSPCLALLLVLGRDEPAQAAASAAASLALLLAPLAWARTLTGFLRGWAWLVPFSVAYALYPLVFHRLAGPEAWLALLQTGAAESSELATYFAAPLGLVALACFAYLAAAITLPPAPLPPALRRACRTAAVAGVLLLPFALPRAFPFGMALDAMAALGTDLRPPAPVPVALRAPGRDAPAKFVLVIGESARRAEFLELLPASALGRERNLLVYDNVVSQAGMTRFSVPMLLGGYTSAAPAPRPNLLGYAHAAGFPITWINADDVAANYAAGADRLVHMRGTGDDELLPAALAELSGSRRFLVLHTMGSHAPYARRYHPVAGMRPAGAGSELEALRAHYRNSIVATQGFLGALVAALARQPGEVFLCYVSDHGENLRDDERQLTLHGFGTRVEYEVPLLFWANDAYTRAHAGRWAELAAHRALPVSSEALLPTLKQALGVDEPGDNGLMGDFRPYERRVRYNTLFLPYTALR